ncbi:trigger factor [Adhaeribacter sp. BT258]|uniref:Trigger factor n=1 Tax=Adhaeribacter terrigena TaxID=2793070 RepID=A0ABS1BYX6_9BACT|nr:trigger factor [Adhaeribacter terrigena]MBK0402332.1 trigger factor [Adhaeribacter terrigena]
MDITLEKQNPTSARLRVKLAEADYAPGVEAQVKEYSKKAQIKGFRPGKVPAGMIRKMYGKSLLVDAINKLLHESVNNYIKENKIKILGEPLPERVENIDWDTQKEFDFSYELGLLPEFELNLGETASVEGYKVEVDDETINEAYEHMQRQFGKTESPETSEANDYIFGELKQLDGDFKTSTLLPLNKLKANQDLFIGKKKGDVITFNLLEAFGNDVNAVANVTGAGKEKAAELKGNFEFTVDNISRTEAAPIDQDFFDKIFGKEAVKSREEFDAKVKETIEENYKQEAEKVLNHKIVDKLVNETKIEVPREFMKKWLLTANEGKLTAEQIEENIENYEKELKWSMIRNKVVEDNGLKVTNQEVVERTKEKMLAQFNMPEVSEEMMESMNQFADNYLRQDNGKNYMNEYEAILAEKVIEALKEKMTVVEKTVTAEEFRNMSF